MCFVRVCVRVRRLFPIQCTPASASATNFPTSKGRQWFFLAERKSVSESYFVTNVLYMKNPCFHLLPLFLRAALPPPDQTSPCGYAPLTVPRVFAAVLSTTGRPPEGAFSSTRAQAKQYRFSAVPEHTVPKRNLQT